MDHFNSARRELLRFGGLGLAAAATTAMPAAAAPRDAPDRTPAGPAYQAYGNNHCHTSISGGEAINDISITGPGLIYGKGLSSGAGPGRVGPPRTGFGPERPAGAPAPPIVRPARGNYTLFQAQQPRVGNTAIAFQNALNARSLDFPLLKAA